LRGQPRPDCLLRLRGLTNIRCRWWGPKVLVWIGFTVASFFIPNEFFIGYGNYVAVVGAGVFILVQLMLLVDFAHTWSETCLENSEETGDKRWQVFIVGGAISLCGGSIALTAVMFGYFSGEGCKLNIALNTVNLALAVVATVLAVHPRIQASNPRSGLSQSSMVVAYTTYLIASAVANEPKSVVGSDGRSCNPLGNSGTQRTTVVLGAVFTFLALVYSTSRAATQGRVLINDSDYEPINAASAVPLTNSQVSVQNKSDALTRAVEAGRLLDPLSLVFCFARLFFCFRNQTSALPQSAVAADQADRAGSSVTDDEREGTAYNYAFFH
ncbi:MAG: serine incorporator/TMS membrane protein, partial [Olpidium bornovanus]